MKALRYILPLLLIAAVVGLMIWQYLSPEGLENGNLIKGLLIIAGAILSLFRPRKNRIVNKKAQYQKAYAEFVEGAFRSNPKLESKFYDAVHDYNQNKPAAGVDKLLKLRKECLNSTDVRAVCVFLALCYDDMGLYDSALTQYDAALAIRPCSTLYSNSGLCCQRMGNSPEAHRRYLEAIRLDPKNAFPCNNLSAMYFRQADYGQALAYALQALEIDPQMPQALSTAAICYGLNGDTENYTHYYRRAVTAGYDGNRIKATVEKLNPNP